MDFSNVDRNESSMTSEEMLDRSDTWTLGCDNALLNKLKTFSENLVQNSEEISKSCESLSKDLTLLQGKLCNVTNEFLMLSNSQFVENRVEEFEESSASEISSTTASGYEEKTKTKAQKASELIAKMTEAIQFGVLANEQNSQLLSVDEDNSTKLSLPYLIGSSKFFSSRYVGLVDENKRFSTITSTKANAISVEDEPFTSFNQPDHNEDRTQPSHSKNSINSLPEIVNDSSGSGSVGDSSNNLYFNSTIQSKKSEESICEPSVIMPPASTKRTTSPPTTSNSVNEYVSSAGPPPPIIQSDDSDDDFKPAASGMSGRLFADDDDDLFNDSSLFPPKPNANLFFSSRNVFPTNPTPVIVPPSHNGSNDLRTPTNPSGIFFTGRMPENNNLSNQSPHILPPNDCKSNTGTETQQSISNPETSSRFKIPAGAVSVFGSVPPAEISRLQHHQNIQPKTQDQREDIRSSSSRHHANVDVSRSGSSTGTNEDHETTSHSSLTSKGISSQGSLGEPNVVSTRSKDVNGLFDDDSDDDLFFSTKKRPDIKVTRNTNLFDDNIRINPHSTSKTIDRNVREIKETTPKTVKVKHSIFDESDSDDDLFSSASSTSSKTKPFNKSIFSSSVVSDESTNSNLFGKNSNVDLFASISDSKSSKVNEPPRMNENANTKQNTKADDLFSIDCNTILASNKDMKMNSDTEENSQPDSTTNTTDSFPEHTNTENSDGGASASGAKGDNQTDIEVSSSENCKSFVDLNLDESSETQETTKKTSTKDEQKTTDTKDMGKNDKSKISKIKESLSSGDLKTKVDDPNSAISKNIKTTGGSTSKVSVKKLALGLNLNPLAMRPGAKPLKRGIFDKTDSTGSSEAGETSSEAATPNTPDLSTVKLLNSEVHPDKEDSSQLLPSLVKGRVKIQSKRRPPSKQLLKSYLFAEQDDDEKDNNKDKTSLHSDELDISNNLEISDIPEAKLEADESHAKQSIKSNGSSSTEEEDLFPANTFIGSQETSESHLPSPTTTQSATEKSLQDVVCEPFEDEIASKEAESTISNVHQAVENLSIDDSDSDDIFASASKKLDVSKSEPSVQPNATTANLFENQEENPIIKNIDLFSTSNSEDDKNTDKRKLKSSSPEASKKKSYSPEEVVNVFEDVDRSTTDFPSSSASDLKSEQPKSKKSVKGLFSDNDDDSSDDIFKPRQPTASGVQSSLGVSKDVPVTNTLSSQPTTSDVPTTKTRSKKSQKGLFSSDSEDSDDLFQSSSRRKKKSFSKIDDPGRPKLLTRSNDEPKQIIPKKVKLATTKSIFSDSSDDDLFSTKKSAVA